MALRHRLKELLKDYSKRYWDLYNKIKGDYPQVAIASFNHRLIIDSPLCNDLIMEWPTFLDDLIWRTENPFTLEEDKIQRGWHLKERNPSSSNRKRKMKSDREQNKAIFQKHYTGGSKPFSPSPSIKWWVKSKTNPFFKWPRAMPSNPSRRDLDKYCTYYKNHRHMTKKCKSLKLFLEDLVKKGLIPKFAKGSI